MRITSSWARGIKVNRMGGKAQGGESLGELGEGGVCLERVVGQVPPRRPSSGHFRALDRDEPGTVEQGSSVGAVCQISSSDHYPLSAYSVPVPKHVRTVKKDCTDTINCSIDAPPPSWVVLGESWGFCFSILLLTNPLTRLL